MKPLVATQMVIDIVLGVTDKAISCHSDGDCYSVMSTG